jgi:hypothetical protein
VVRFKVLYRQLSGETEENLLLLLLLPLALQPTVGFGLSNKIIPFFPIRHQLSPSSLNPSSFPLFDFRNNKFLLCGVVSPKPNPKLEDQGIPFCLGHHP